MLPDDVGLHERVYLPAFKNRAECSRMPITSRATSRARPRVGVKKSTMPAMPNPCRTQAVRFIEDHRLWRCCRPQQAISGHRHASQEIHVFTGATLSIVALASRGSHLAYIWRQPVLWWQHASCSPIYLHLPGTFQQLVLTATTP